MTAHAFWCDVVPCLCGATEFIPASPCDILRGGDQKRLVLCRSHARLWEDPDDGHAEPTCDGVACMTCHAIAESEREGRS